MNEVSAVWKATEGAGRRTTAILLAAGLFAISGLTLGLYQSFFFRFANFYAFTPSWVGLIFSVFYIAYFALAVPAALFHRRFGYKLGLLLGLSSFVFAAFLMYVAVVQRTSGFFLAAVAMMGSSGVLLDTALNPLAVEAGNPSTSIARLNITHAFNGLGLFGGYFTAVTLFEKHFELSLGAATPYSARPYILIGLVAMLLAFFVEQVPLPSFAGKDKTSTLRHEFGCLLGDKGFLTAAASGCACCAALMILWSASYRYHVDELPGHVIAVFERGWFWFVIGRLVGCTLLRWVDPMRLLQWSVGLCLIAAIVAAVIGGVAGWVSLLSASALLSISYPTVLGSALEGHRTRIRLAAGLLLAAGGIGSALLAVSTNVMLDVLFVHPRVVVCLALPFLAVVLAYARTAHRACNLRSEQLVFSD